MTRSLCTALLAALALAATLASPANALTAPGRIAISTATKAPEHNVDAGGGGPAVALPDGGAIVASSDRTFKGFTLVRLQADGSLEASFGSGGIARIRGTAATFGPKQLLRLPDGRLIVTADGPPASRYQLPSTVLARLSANGALDTSFGTGGFATPAIQNGNAALAPDGSLVLTGTIGQVSPEIETNPFAPSQFEWAVQRITPAGTIDTAFGVVKIPGPTGTGSGGRGVVVRPSGQIVVLGAHADIGKLAGLTASGAADPAFNGGLPVTIAGGPPAEMLLHATGAIDVVAPERLTRFTTAGVADGGFGANGAVAFTGFSPALGPPMLLTAPDGGTLLQRVASFEPSPSGQPRVRVQRIAPSGTLGTAVDLEPAFGGGISASLHGVRQNGFRGRLLPRAGGGYLLVGGLNVVQYTGEGEGFSAGFLAVAAYDALLRPDERFGGPQQAGSARVRLPRQRVRADVNLDRVLARVTASGPGLVQVRVRDGRRRILAQSVVPVYKAGTSSARIRLTRTGRRILRSRGANVRVTVGLDFRDILTGRDRDEIVARLR
jgi:uncharacterized delta-60 repeat protein